MAHLWWAPPISTKQVDNVIQLLTTKSLMSQLTWNYNILNDIKYPNSLAADGVLCYILFCSVESLLYEFHWIDTQTDNITTTKKVKLTPMPHREIKKYRTTLTISGGCKIHIFIAIQNLQLLGRKNLKYGWYELYRIDKLYAYPWVTNENY